MGTRVQSGIWGHVYQSFIIREKTINNQCILGFGSELRLNVAQTGENDE